MPETRLWGRGERAWRRSGRGRRREGPDSRDRDAGDPPELPRAARARRRRRGEPHLPSERAGDSRDPHPCAPWGLTSPQARARRRGNLLHLFLRNGSFPVWEEKSSPNLRAVGFTHTRRRGGLQNNSRCWRFMNLVEV